MVDLAEGLGNLTMIQVEVQAAQLNRVLRLVVLVVTEEPL